MRLRKDIRIFLACIIGVMLVSAAASAEPTIEQQLTAKILAELPRYVKIKGKQDVLPILCVEKKSGLYNFIRSLPKARQTYSSVELYKGDLAKCQFVYTSNAKSARELIATASGHETLVISNYHNFIDEGGAIGLSNKNGFLSIELNLSTAKDKQAVFSPDLIELSGRVIQ